MITLDSNILLYMNDNRDPSKRQIAYRVVRTLARSRARLALQVVGETQNTLRRKFKRSASEAATIGRQIVEAFELVPATATDVEVALDQMETGRLSYWDALLVSTVARAGCTALLTEDMQDGVTVLGVEIVNPFGPDGLSARAAELLAGPGPSGGTGRD